MQELAKSTRAQVDQREMEKNLDIEKIIRDHLATIELLDDQIPAIEDAAVRLEECLESGGKICWIGNGGSAADCQHLAAELVGRYTRERQGLASIALTTDTSALTAIGNDYGYDRIFARQIEALCTARDSVVGISTSGDSANVLEGIRVANELGAFTLGLAGGSGGKLAELADKCLIVSSSSTARVQEAHILIGHILCDWLEERSVARV